MMAGAGGELRRIVHINEEIKRVVATALRINLMAMNAIFLARRAGRTALGFGVLSHELRRFAADLRQQMAALGEMTYGSVATVTGMVKQGHINRLLERTRAEAAGSGRKLVDDRLYDRDGDAMLHHEERIAAVNRRLTQMIADTAQLVELGSVLARSAKIEAAYGGGFSADLMQVSSDFEATIAEIQQSLGSLTRHPFREAA